MGALSIAVAIVARNALVTRKPKARTAPEGCACGREDGAAAGQHAPIPSLAAAPAPPTIAPSTVAASAAGAPFWFDARPTPIEPLPPTPRPSEMVFVRVVRPAVAPPEPQPAQELDAEPPPAQEPEPEPQPAHTPEPEPLQAQEPVPEPDPAWRWSDTWGYDLAETQLRSRPPRKRRRGRRFALPLVLATSVAAIVVGLWAAMPRPHTTAARSVEVASVTHQPGHAAAGAGRIPAGYLRIYKRVALEYGLDWNVLAAVGEIESHSGRSAMPGVVTGTNSFGAAGPAQFLSATWARYGVDADGNGSPSPYDPLDAITAMAAYLKASGAPQDWSAALYTYNHSAAYVQQVLTLSHNLSAQA